MAGHWTDGFSYSRGIIFRQDELYFILTKDELAGDSIPHAVIAVNTKDGWDAIEIEYNLVGIAVAEHPKKEIVFIGEHGQVEVIDADELYNETIIDDKKTPKKLGPMRQVRAIDGYAHAVGMGNQIYKRININIWNSISDGINTKKNKIHFESIDGFSPSDIYTVGRGGEIWHNDAKGWKRIDSPTNFILTDVCCAGDGSVYVCGRLGMLIKGRNNRWEIIDHGSTVEDFWSLAWYKNKLYISTTSALFTLEESNSLKIVNMGDDIPSSCYHVSTGDGMLLSVGRKDVMIFDGEEWERID